LNPFEIRCEAIISAAGAKRLRQGHLWIYAGDVVRDPEDPSPAIVKVADQNQNFLGYAFYSRHSQIRLRLLSRNALAPTPEFLRARVRTSIQRRRNILDPGCACRLVFGEGDFLPSIIVDRYGDYLVLQTLSFGSDAIKHQLVEILREAMNPQGIVERNDVKARRLEGLEETSGILWGPVPDVVRIQEDGIQFEVDLLHGQKTGFFLDQRENRLTAGKYATGRGLDCFTNTGAFALHFARRCESVLAVDISGESTTAARRNADLNGFTNVDFQIANVFDFLRELEKAGEAFDTICLDPPAFAKNRRALVGARSGYKEINLRAMRLLKPEGILITSSCSYHLSEPDFFELLGDAARDAHRYLQVVERRGQASDHPVLSGMPETLYLKCFVLRVIA
jgi:23S rRNA (cytosine1962-C5)-methyltransferase